MPLGKFLYRLETEVHISRIKEIFGLCKCDWRTLSVQNSGFANSEENQEWLVNSLSRVAAGLQRTMKMTGECSSLNLDILFSEGYVDLLLRCIGKRISRSKFHK